MEDFPLDVPRQEAIIHPDEAKKADVIFENGLYKVQVGVFDDIDNAAMMEMNLRNVGYNTFIPRRY